MIGGSSPGWQWKSIPKSSRVYYYCGARDVVQRLSRHLTLPWLDCPDGSGLFFAPTWRGFAMFRPKGNQVFTVEEISEVGRPLSIKTPEEFTQLADAFFADCLANEKPTTITGLALAVGLSSRQSLSRYESRKEFSDVVKRARARVEAAYEGRLWANNPTGAIFALKNMGWDDKQKLEHSGGVTIAATPLDLML